MTAPADTADALDLLDLDELQRLCDVATTEAQYGRLALFALPKLIAKVRELQAQLEHADKCLRFETTKDDSDRQRLGRELCGGEHG